MPWFGDAPFVSIPMRTALILSSADQIVRLHSHSKDMYVARVVVSLSIACEATVTGGYDVFTRPYTLIVNHTYWLCVAYITSLPSHIASSRKVHILLSPRSVISILQRALSDNTVLYDEFFNTKICNMRRHDSCRNDLRSLRG